MSRFYTDEQIEWILAEEPNYTWADLAVEFTDKFGVKKTANAVRKCHNMYKDIDWKSTEEVSYDAIRKANIARKGRSQANKELKKVLEQIEGQEEFISQFDKVLKSNPIKVHKPISTKKSKKKSSRTLFAHISDIHLHSLIDGDEMGGVNQYKELEQARRLAYFIREVATWKTRYRDETDLVLALNGDLLQGIIHDIESTAPMTTQIAAGISLLSQAISFVAQQFKSVRVVCTMGNHSRFMHKSNKGRQTSQKWDGFGTIMHVSLKYALKDHKNVEFEIPLTPYALIDIQGHKYLIVHGDTVLNPGNVGKSISTESIKNKVNDLISGLGKIDVVVAGHVHVPAYTVLNNGVELVVNGNLSGVDTFCQSIGILKNYPCQQMFEITDKYAVGDMRFVKVEEADSDSELDKIIKPFFGKF